MCLGFITASSGGGHSTLLRFPVEQAVRLTSIAKSIGYHDKHDAIAGTRHHFARLATLAASPHILSEEFRAASSAHRAANKAKHGGRHRFSCAAAAPSLPR